MVIKIGINGFGRIGRMVFRKCLENEDLTVGYISYFINTNVGTFVVYLPIKKSPCFEKQSIQRIDLKMFQPREDELCIIKLYIICHRWLL